MLTHHDGIAVQVNLLQLKLHEMRWENRNKIAYEK